MNVEHVLTVGNVIGEGPRWNSAEQRLYWVDFIENQNIHSWSPLTGELHTYPTPSPVTALGFRRDGKLIVATRGEVATFDFAAGSLASVATLEQGPPKRLNDGAVDARGRFWVGSMNAQKQEEPEVSLYRLDPDGRVQTLDTGFTVSNGMGWSPDQRVFYFIDTFRWAVYAYDYSAEPGTIGNRRIFAQCERSDGFPDGMAVDAAGNVLVAFWGGWKIIRFSPDGRREREIRFPVANPTACAFGGANLDELYVTTAKLALSPAELVQQPLAGDLFRVKMDVRGQKEPCFG